MSKEAVLAAVTLAGGATFVVHPHAAIGAAIGCWYQALFQRWLRFFSALNRTGNTDDPLPLWLGQILDRIPFLKRGDRNDG